MINLNNTENLKKASKKKTPESLPLPWKPLMFWDQSYMYLFMKLTNPTT